ncbi:hypothetical protein [Hymenobacter actinosclerus]|uniref:Uncharacterized protein n=1 Tax=Hymenobacter actinosclerus TaxID=82805 RepID=A0A1I0AIG1_9BACT|nr:hypothetical protein [Hymenobacter actinosclerus]SES93467.1 hypothetical protein SAMN04487998_0713 [Hymenobacter actinosclerus]
MRYTLLLFCLLLAAPGLRAQKSKDARPPIEPRQELRTELPLQYTSSEVQVQPLAEDSSVVLLVEQDGRLTSRPTYSFQKLDYQLRPAPARPLEVPRGYDFQRICAEGTDVYALFSGTVEGTLWVAAYDTRTGELATGEFKTKKARQIHNLTALDGNLFVTVEVNQHLTVLLLNLTTAQFQFLPSVYEPMPARFTLVADSVTRRAELILSETNGFKSRLQLKQLDQQGQLLRSEFVQAGSERGLLDAQLSSGDSAARILAGTYTLRDSRFSQGLFAADLTAGTTPTGQRRSLRFYDFLNFKHFFDFMKPSRVARLRQRQARLREGSDGSRQPRHRYQLLMHDMLPTPEGFVLVAEVYYARYTSGNGAYTALPGSFAGLPYGYGGYGPGGFGYPSRYNSFYSNRRPPSGYHFSHAIVMGLDRQGNLLWDNSFLLDDINRAQLEETVAHRPLADGRMVLAYLKDDKLYYKLVDQTTPSPNDWQVRLRTAPLAAATPEGTQKSSEKTISTYQEHLMPWYGSRFLAVGYQTIRPERGAVRDVFFLNDLAF